MCCNADTDCNPTTQVPLLEMADSFAFDSYASFSLLLVAGTAALICLLASVSYARDARDMHRKRSISTSRASYRLRKEMADDRLALDQMGEGSVYSFLLRKNVAGWAIALLTIGLQGWMVRIQFCHFPDNVLTKCFSYIPS